MTARTLIKPLIPPIVSRWRHRRCATWDEAKRLVGRGYDDETVTRFRVDRALHRTPLNPADNILYLVSKMYSGPLHIVDFGGSTGELGEAICSVAPDIRYTVVETAILVAMAEKKLAHIPVTFTTTIPDRCDVFFTGGTLQVLDDPYVIVDTAFRVASSAVVFARNCFSEKDIIRVLNGRLFDNGNGPIPGGYQNRRVRYPYRTISERRIQDAAARYGFSCVARIRELDAVTAFDDTVYGAQLAFQRRTHARRCSHGDA
jgi:putative methyltransferase (TIGR04325 family)